MDRTPVQINAAAYLRISTPLQTNDNQEVHIRNFPNARGFNLVDIASFDRIARDVRNLLNLIHELK